MTGAIHRSSADCQNWGVVRNQANNPTWALAATANGYLYAGTEDSGVLFSIDDGITWNSLGTGLTLNNVRALAVHHATGRMYAGTYGHGVFVSTVRTAVEEARHAHAMPEAFALHANSPNPFNPSTNIQYEVSRSVEVKLEIFDMMGRHVRALVQERQPAGHYAITWDGRNEHGEQVGSGIYLYQLNAGDFVQARRMALVR